MDKENWPKNNSLKDCDLGLESGVLKGASRSLPRYFSDSDLVQDINSKIIFCMNNLQVFYNNDLHTKPGFKKKLAQLLYGYTKHQHESSLTYH